MFSAKAFAGFWQGLLSRDGEGAVLRSGPYAGFRISASLAATDAIRALARSISFSQQPLIEIVTSRKELPENCRRGGW
jgi:hypothetical protein